MRDLSLMRLMYTKRQRQIRDHGSIASVDRKKVSPCQQDDNSQGGEGIRSRLNLPEDIWRHIHGLMPLRDAARAACVSHTFLRSWRCHPNLTFSKQTLGFNGKVFGEDKMTRDLISKVDHILQNHSGIGMKKLELEFHHCNNVDSCYLNSWLHIAITAGIEELTMLLPPDSKAEYSFPCSLLFNGSGNSVRYLHLANCAFRPTASLGCWGSLTRLYLCVVRITEDELECLLSNSFALELLKLIYCDEIICLKIPCLVQRLSFLHVAECKRLQVIESDAPNLSTLHFSGAPVRISFGGSLQVKNIRMRGLCHQSNMVWYARTKLLSIVPNVETLSISSSNEKINTPMVPGKFLHLKYLCISLVGLTSFSPAYDYLSLVSFLDASPCLETFIICVSQSCMKHDSILGDSSHLRQLPEHRHDNLKSVKIAGFCSAKSLVELTCHVVENSMALECLTLDTTCGSAGCSVNKPGKCFPMERDNLMEARRALLAIRTHIEGKVPSRVKLNVLEPCSRCHPVEL